MSRKLDHISCVLAILVAMSSSTFARPGDDPLKPPKDLPPTRAERAKAKAHFNKATKLYDKKKYDEALVELHDAEELDSDPDTLYAIAQVHVKLGHCVDAIHYYERFLETNPGPRSRSAARGKIELCKPKVPPLSSPPVVLKPSPIVTEPEPVKTRIVVGQQPWYKDKLGDTLMLGGITSSIIAFYFYRGALSDLDAADASMSLADHARHVDDAHGKRTYSLIAGGAGATLVSLGLVRYAFGNRTERHTVSIVPAHGGGVIAFSGSFE